MTTLANPELGALEAMPLGCEREVPVGCENEVPLTFETGRLTGIVTCGVVLVGGAVVFGTPNRDPLQPPTRQYLRK